MADIDAVATTTHRILVSGDNSYTFTAGETMYAGQAVQLTAAAGDFTITAADSADTSALIGVLDAGVTSGDTDALVHLYGCVCYVANNDDTTAIEAGNMVKATTNSNDIDGAVAGVTPGSATEYILGIAMEDIAADGWGKVLICPEVNLIA